MPINRREFFARLVGMVPLGPLPPELRAAEDIFEGDECIIHRQKIYRQGKPIRLPREGQIKPRLAE